MAEHQVLFCPFCRESFEQQYACPEHELKLVPFDQLHTDSALFEPEPDDEDEPAQPLVAAEDRDIAAYDPGWGRGIVALGAALNLAALGLRLLGPPATASLYTLARTSPSLWTLGLVSFTVFFTLARRRTPRKLRSLRVLVPWLALLSPLTLLWTLYRLGGPGSLSLGPAPYAVGLASLLLLVGGARLGAPRLSTRA